MLDKLVWKGKNCPESSCHAHDELEDMDSVVVLVVHDQAAVQAWCAFDEVITSRVASKASLCCSTSLSLVR